MSNYRHRLGIRGEKIVEKYLIKNGYDIISRHWQKREGEIDIVALDRSHSCLVFVEVKTRRSMAYGRPDESITMRKKQAIESTINKYLNFHNFQNTYRCDVVMVNIGHTVNIEHLMNVSLE